MQQKTDDQYVEDMKKFVGSPDTCEHTLVVDPSAASFIVALRVAGYIVIPAKNDVMDGIKRVSSLIAKRRLSIHSSCKGLIAEMERYLWDEKASRYGEEKPLKIDDHAPDALRYFCMTCLGALEIYTEE
jgi:phage terminase large subunit